MKAGEFKATCRKGRWVPAGTLTDEEIERAQKVPATDLLPERLHTRWDKKLKLEVAAVHCQFETADRAAFEQHMRELHDGGFYRWNNGSLGVPVRTVRNYSPRTRFPVKPWKGPNLTEEGTPWSDENHPTETCEGCGMVVDASFSTPYTCPGCGDLMVPAAS